MNLWAQLGGDSKGPPPPNARQPGGPLPTGNDHGRGPGNHSQGRKPPPATSTGQQRSNGSALQQAANALHQVAALQGASSSSQKMAALPPKNKASAAADKSQLPPGAPSSKKKDLKSKNEDQLKIIDENLKQAMLFGSTMEKISKEVGNSKRKEERKAEDEFTALYKALNMNSDQVLNATTPAQPGTGTQKDGSSLEVSESCGLCNA